jgi:hypothetical protein
MPANYISLMPRVGWQAHCGHGSPAPGPTSKCHSAHVKHKGQQAKYYKGMGSRLEIRKINHFHFLIKAIVN